MSNTRVERVERFVASARAYCRLIEGERRLQRPEFLRKAARLLAALVHDALDLPEVRTRSQRTLGEVVDPDPGRELFPALQNKLGDVDPFWVVFDPRVEEKPVCGSLADCLADVHRDVKRGLLAWDSWGEEGRHEAVWKWKFDFASHWGYHALEALHAIYWRALRD